MSQPSIQELFDACRVLFGEEVQVSLEFLRYLKPSGVKSAYWKRAKETHPDRAEFLGLNVSVLSDQFRTLTGAYLTLHGAVSVGADSFLKNNSNPFPSESSGHSPDFRKRPSSTGEEESDHYYTGRFPTRPLRIGQFLYYSGVVSWRSLISAILWQRRNRPLIGQIALDWKMLTHADIPRILRNRRLSEKFGESALRLGYINKSNLLALLGRQRKIQKPFGVYFVDRQILLPEELTRQLIRQRLHNRKPFR